jgi:molybdate transport system permease protein
VVTGAAVSLPLVVRSVRLAIEAVDVKREQAAHVCGATPVDVWLTVTLPGAWPGIVLGMLLTFVRSLGEFGATIMFAGNIAGETRTLPLALFNAMETPGASAAVTRLAVAASEYLNRRCRTAREAG